MPSENIEIFMVILHNPTLTSTRNAAEKHVLSAHLMSLAAKLYAAASPAVPHTEELSHTGSKRHERPARKKRTYLQLKTVPLHKSTSKKQATSGQEGFIKQT